MITDPAAVKFSNEYIRVAADLFTQGYYRAKAAVQTYQAQGLDNKFTDTDVVDDGADKDGRSVITGAHIKRIVRAMEQFIAEMEANNNAKLNEILSVAVNPIPGGITITP